ncbi:hypothetical protein LEMLEM_LOCUS15993 [Lemmus lemmus]
MWRPAMQREGQRCMSPAGRVTWRWSGCLSPAMPTSMQQTMRSAQLCSLRPGRATSKWSSF